MDRTGFIGGSDWKDILDMEPYGCRRRLHFEKNGLMPDFNPQNEGVLRRGKMLEPVAAQEFCEVTTRKLRKIPEPDPDESTLPWWWKCQIDHGIQACAQEPPPFDKPGNLEIKTCGTWMFRKVVREGCPLPWEAQVQAGMAYTRRAWSAVFVLNVENWESLVFKFLPDLELVNDMKEQGHLFMEELTGDPPVALDPRDPRCKKCVYRATCQGTALLDIAEQDLEFGQEIEEISDPTLDVLCEQQQELLSIAKEADTEAKKLTDQIKAHLGSPGVRKSDSYLISYGEHKRSKFDKKQAEIEHPDLIAKYTSEYVVRPLRVYEIA